MVQTPTLLLRFFLSFRLPLLLDLWWLESDDDELEDLEQDGTEEERQTLHFRKGHKTNWALKEGGAKRSREDEQGMADLEDGLVSGVGRRKRERGLTLMRSVVSERAIPRGCYRRRGAAAQLFAQALNVWQLYHLSTRGSVSVERLLSVTEEVGEEGRCEGRARGKIVEDPYRRRRRRDLALRAGEDGGG